MRQSINFQCPDTGEAVTATYQNGRLEVRAVESDPNWKTSRWMVEASGKCGTFDLARLRLMDAGCAPADVAADQWVSDERQDYRRDPSRRLSPAVNVHHDSGDTFRVMVDDRCHGVTSDEASAWEIAKRVAKERPFVFVDLLCPALSAE
jgi:hypothetical protein